MKIHNALLSLILAIPFSGFGQSWNPDRFSLVDQHVSEINRQAIFHPQILVNMLTKDLSNDYDKVRAIYVWIASNIEYDMLAYYHDRNEGQGINQVLRSGKALCSGYSLLFQYFCQLASVEAVIIEGYAKGYGYKKGDSFKESNHAWNAVNIYGSWYLLDATWAAGMPVESSKRRNQPDTNSYFLVDPAKFVETHLPEDPSWQLIEQKVSLYEFETGNSPDQRDQRFDDFSPNYYATSNEYDQDLIKFKRATAFHPGNSQLNERLCFAYIYKAISITDNVWKMSYSELADTVESLASNFRFYADSALQVANAVSLTNSTYLRRVVQDEINYQKGVFNYEIGIQLFEKARNEKRALTRQAQDSERYFSSASAYFRQVPESSIYRHDADEYLANIREFKNRNPDY